MLAVQRNNPEVVKFLLDKGCDVFAKDHNGNTIAYYLVRSFDNIKPDEFDYKLR